MFDLPGGGSWQGLTPPPLDKDDHPVVTENFGMGVGFNPSRPVPAENYVFFLLL